MVITWRRGFQSDSRRVSGAAAGEVCAPRRVWELNPGLICSVPRWGKNLQLRQNMGGVRLAVHTFLWSLSAVYMFAFASVYVQIPGEVLILFYWT